MKNYKKFMKYIENNKSGQRLYSELLDLIKKFKECHTYNDIYNYDIELMTLIISEYGNDAVAWNLFKNLYEDPDSYLVEKDIYIKTGIKCTVDGLLSKTRIYRHEGFGKEFIITFKEYRKTPIIFFPADGNHGINWNRFAPFNDRIDCVLFDIKRKCEGATDCVLEHVYDADKYNTKHWLEYFNYDFNKIVNWLKIKGIFVNEKNEVYNLEYDDQRVFKEGCQYENRNKWSDNYYKNIKKKIKEFEEKINNKNK